MKILITGATGLIGTQIVEDCLNKNIKVNFLTTSKSKINTFHSCKGYYWNPEQKQIDLACFEGVNAIINLSGASIFRLWSKKNKRLILNSRVNSLKFLNDTIAENNIKIDTIVSASGIGAYPSSYDKEYDENEKKKSNYFLADVIKKWESASTSFNDIIKNVSIIRIGLVLSEKGGVLKQTMQPMMFGFGVYFGSGKQWQSWIHIKDISRLFIHSIEMNLNGIYNGVAPNPLSNFLFTKIISKIKGNVYILISVPKIIFKIIFGEMHLILFKSQNISCKKIQATGFKFYFNEIENSIKDILK
tara:strand:- start:586 stop:1491 length:906 start_codon:yes stop_codon:yes gene_type:complete